MARKRKPQPKGEEEIHKFTEWLQHLANASRDRIVLVQHKSDADILSSLQIKNVYFYTKPEFGLLSKIIESGKECILIFDVNKNSNKLAERIKSELQQRGVKVNTRFRKILFTSKFKELSGILTYLHEQVAETPRKHASVNF
ncbi:MAG: hypothetical protein QXU88_01155 [Candidatus Woesearchaeota archaeon]